MVHQPLSRFSRSLVPAMTREHQRQTEQIAWLQSGEPLTVGRLDALGGPDVLEALAPIDRHTLVDLLKNAPAKAGSPKP